MNEMLEFGGTFDEDLFGETRDRSQKKPLSSYNAKICLPGWFQNKSDDHPADDYFNVQKYCGDLAYLKGQYRLAIAEYNKCLGALPSNNTAMRRDVTENVARCYISLQDYRQALVHAKQVEEQAQNFEHTTSSFNLLSTVYQKLDMYEERLVCLQKALTLHSCSPSLWLELAETYLKKHTKQISPGAAQLKPKQQCSGCNGLEPINIDKVFDKKCVVAEEKLDKTDTSDRLETVDISQTSNSDMYSNLDYKQLDTQVASTGLSITLVICTCLVRARSLLQSVQRNIVSFAKNENIKLEKQVHCDISNLAIPKDIYDKCVEHVNIDVFGLESLYQPDSRDDRSSANQGNLGQTPVDVILEGFSSNSFEKKWFSWYATIKE